MRRIAAAVGSNVASPIVESMDINAILEEIDINSLLDRIDVNQLFERIDVNRVLDRVDVNRHLDRVDYDRHLDNVDLNALIAKSNLEQIISRATSGVFSGIFNLIRTRMAWIDQWGQKAIGKCCCCYEIFYCCCSSRANDVVYYLPPRPGRHPEDSYTEWINSGSLNQRQFSKKIQFRTCGALNRIISGAIDQAIIWFTFALISAIITKLGTVFSDNGNSKIHFGSYFSGVMPWYYDMLLLGIWNFLYFSLLVGCFGKSIGMWILGLLMVSCNGSRVSFLRVCVHTFLMPFSFLLFGSVVGFFRRDGKSWGDLIGGVAIVYAYDSSAMVDTKNSAEMAMSLTDFAHVIATEKEEEDHDEDDKNNDENDERCNNSSKINDGKDGDGDIECGNIHDKK